MTVHHIPSRRLAAPALALTFALTAAGTLPASAATRQTLPDVLPATTELVPEVAPADMPADGLAESPYSADPLPTVQHDGIAHEQLVVGDTVYVMGEFANARPAGLGAEANVPRANMLAYDLHTGELVESFAPSFDGPTFDAVASEDGRWLFVVGGFQNVDGTPHARIVKLDATTGEVDQTFTAGTNARVTSIARAGQTLYLGGIFGDVSGTTRQRLAAIDTSGAVLDWAPAANESVRSLDVSPDGSTVIVGGAFTSVDGADTPGLALLDAATGAVRPMAVTDRLRTGGTQAAVTSVKADAGGFVATAYVWGGGTGNWEGVVRGAWDGSLTWYADSYGDTYDAQVIGDRVVAVGHPHDLANLGGAPEVDPQRFYHAVMFTDEARTTNGTNWYLGREDFRDLPAPGLAEFLPSLAPGNVSGAWQAAWTVEATDEYLLLGGEFVDVEGTYQNGLVRLPLRGTVEDRGPELVDLAPRAEVLEDGSVHLAYSRASDPDDADLTYTVEREGAAEPVYRGTLHRPEWDPGVGELIDHAAPAGTTSRYRVVVSDPWGNTDVSPWTEVTVPAQEAVAPTYPSRVLGDGASHYWRLDETQGLLAGATTGWYDLESRGGTETGLAGIPGTASDGGTAWAFSGDYFGHARPLVRQAPSEGEAWSSEVWFKPEAGTDGELITYAHVPSKFRKSPDVSLYLDATGALRAAFRDGSTAVIAGGDVVPTAWEWHHAVAVFTTGGVELYLDGELVGSATGPVRLPEWDGGWHLGGGAGAPFPGASTTTYQGELDEVAVYPTALDAATIGEHHLLGLGLPTTPEPEPTDPGPGNGKGMDKGPDHPSNTKGTDKGPDHPSNAKGNPGTGNPGGLKTGHGAQGDAAIVKPGKGLGRNR